MKNLSIRWMALPVMVSSLAFSLTAAESAAPDKEKNNISAAIVQFREAADRGDAAGMTNLGRCYLTGNGVETNISKGVALLKLAADKGNPEAMRYLGQIYLLGLYEFQRDSAQAAEFFAKAAEGGDGEAQFWYGICCWKGAGIPPNREKALESFSKVAEQGCPEGLLAMSLCYKKGATEEEQKRAVELLKKAADAGSGDAYYFLGLAACNGVNGKVDYSEAVKYFQKADMCNSAYGQYALGCCYEQGCGVAQDWKLAMKMYQKAAASGNVYALYALGRFYELGTGVDMDWNKALEYFEKADKGGLLFAGEKIKMLNRIQRLVNENQE